MGLIRVDTLMYDVTDEDNPIEMGAKTLLMFQYEDGDDDSLDWEDTQMSQGSGIKYLCGGVPSRILYAPNDDIVAKYGITFDGYMNFNVREYDLDGNVFAGKWIEFQFVKYDNLAMRIYFPELSYQDYMDDISDPPKCWKWASDDNYDVPTIHFYKDGSRIQYMNYSARYMVEYTRYNYSDNQFVYYYSLPWVTKDGSEYCQVWFIGNLDRKQTADKEWRIVVNHSDQGISYWDTFLEDTEFDEFDGTNPYAGGGISTTSDNDNANFSEDSDTVTEDELPSIDITATGFDTIFTPDRQQLRTLAGVLWSSDFFTFMQNSVENLLDLFTSLSVVPFNVDEGDTVEVTWLGLSTGVSLTLATQQFYEFEMGEIDLSNDSRIFTSGSVLDYSPYSRLGIFLPFIGYQELDIDECRDAVISLKYRIDIVSGACIALINVAGNTIYQFSGECLCQIPMTKESMTGIVSNVVNVGIAAAGMATAKGAATAAANNASNIPASELATKEGKAKMSAATAALSRAETGVSQARGNLDSATIDAVMTSKPTFKKSGAISSTASMLGVKQPYLFLITPRQSMPANYGKYVGFPSNITATLGNLKGYTVVEDIRLNGLVATSPEVSEIYKLLKSGVII